MSSIDFLKKKEVQQEDPQDHCHGHGAAGTCSSGARGGHSRLGQRLSGGHVLGLRCLSGRGGLGLGQAVLLELFEAGPVVVLVVPQWHQFFGGMPQGGCPKQNATRGVAAVALRGGNWCDET